MMKNLSFCLSMLLAIPALSQEGYRIEMEINGCEPGTAILAYYYGNKQYIKDSTRVDASGKFVFAGEEELDQGIYIAVMPPDNKYFELIVNEDQHFKMTSAYSKPVESMKITGNEANKRFYEYLRFLNKQKKKSEPLSKQIEALQQKDSAGYRELPEFKEIAEQMDALDEEVKEFKNKYIEDHPQDFMSHVFLASKDPDVPEAPVLENGKQDSTFAWRYFKDHYWDNVNFEDDRILRTPVFHSRLERFFTKTVPQNPDSIIKEADRLVELTRPSNELFKYVVFWVTSHFETSKTMGMESVFVHMAQEYYMTGQAFWADSTTVKKIGDRATKLNYSLIGKKAPNLIMKDTSGVFQVLHSIPAKYTIAYFWDPECGHCKKVTPKVRDFYNEFKEELDVEVYGVNTNAKERDSWLEYIRENELNWINVEDPEQKTAYKYLYDIYSTPVIYLLDKDKKIIAKRIGAEDLEKFIRFHMKKNS